MPGLTRRSVWLATYIARARPPVPRRCAVQSCCSSESMQTGLYCLQPACLVCWRASMRRLPHQNPKPPLQCQQVLAARAALPDVALSEAHARFLVEQAARLGCQGQRAELSAARVARAAAALRQGLVGGGKQSQSLCGQRRRERGAMLWHGQQGLGKQGCLFTGLGRRKTQHLKGTN